MGFCHYPRPAGWPHCQRERVSLGSSVVNGDRSFQCVLNSRRPNTNGESVHRDGLPLIMVFNFLIIFAVLMTNLSGHTLDRDIGNGTRFSEEHRHDNWQVRR